MLWRTTGYHSAVVVIVEHSRVVHHCLPVCRRWLDMVRQLAAVSAQYAVGMGDRAADRCRIRAIGDVQLGGDELIGQDKAGVSVLSRADWGIEDNQELGLGISLAAQCQAIHGPRVRIVFPVTLWLRTNARGRGCWR